VTTTDPLSLPLPAGKHRRRWFQYSLRALLVVVTLCALACSWLGVKLQQAWRQRAAVAVVQELGGRVLYDWLYEAKGNMLRKAQPPGSPWLRRLLGDDLFQSVYYVNLTGTPVTDAGIEKLQAALPNCKIYH
jgi:hypothetical protein